MFTLAAQFVYTDGGLPLIAVLLPQRREQTEIGF
jgi:hypothetical protein